MQEKDFILLFHAFRRVLEIIREVSAYHRDSISALPNKYKNKTPRIKS